MYPNMNFDPFNTYSGRGYNVNQPQPQTIRNLAQAQVEPQVLCYFVKSPSDLNSVNIMPNTFYLGLNSDKNEIYLRKMNNDGLTEIKTYQLESETKEKNDLQAVLERLDNIEKKMSESRSTLTLKGKDNERTSRTISE